MNIATPKRPTRADGEGSLQVQLDPQMKIEGAKVFAVYIPQTEMDPFGSDEDASQAPRAFTKHIKGASPSCFMHVSMMGFDTKGLKHLAQSEFRLKFPNLPTDVIPTVLFVRMLWAHWVLTGGVPADHKKCAGIVEDLLDHLKAWDHYIVMENLKVRVKLTVEDELPGGSAEQFLAGLDPKKQVSLLEGASIDAVMSDDWPSIAEELEKTLRLPKNSVLLYFGQHACRHSFDHVDQKFQTGAGKTSRGGGLERHQEVHRYCQ